jgi:hypothetical protein
LQAALADLKRPQRFSQVFEEHLSETTALYRLPVQPGSLVQRRDDPSGRTLYRISAVKDGVATTELLDGGSAERDRVKGVSTHEQLRQLFSR